MIRRLPVTAALARVYVAAYSAPSGYGSGEAADAKRQETAAKAVRHFIKTLEDIESEREEV